MSGVRKATTALVFAAALVACTREPYRPRPLAMTDDERAYLMGVARRALEQYFRDGTELAVTDLPRALRRFDKRVVFATYHVDGDTRGCYSANEAGVGTNVVKAVVRTAHDDRYLVKGVTGPRGKPVTLRPEEVSKVRIELNVLGNYERLAFNDADALRGEIEPGVHGVRIAQGKNGAYYLPYVGIEFEYDILPYLRTLSSKAKLKPDAWQKTAALWRFEAVNFVEESAGGASLLLYRWNTAAPAPTRESLAAAVARAERFVRRAMADAKTRQGWHPKRKVGLGEAAAWLRERAVAVAGAAPRAPAALAKPPASTPAPLAAKFPAAASKLLAAAHKAPGAPSPAAGRARAAELAWRCLGPASRGACTSLAKLVRPDGRLDPAARAPLVSWEREHQDVVAAIRALAAPARTGRFLAAAKALLARAEADYGARVFAWADLAVAAMAVRAGDPDGAWLERARAYGERVAALQLAAANAPTPDQRGALQLDRTPATSDAARAALAFALLARAGERRFLPHAREAARFVLGMQFRPDNTFAFPEIPRYEGGVRPDLHHVPAHVESTLDALEAWRAVAEALR